MPDLAGPLVSSGTVRAGRALVAGGIALRLAQLLNGRPIWLDEATLALNILARGFRDFFQPLASVQISPLGFLWLESAFKRLGGASEVSLRVIPWVAGVLALIAFARLARRLLDPGPALFATALAALSPLLIDYSAELKSYSLDALTAILLIHATLDLAEKRTPRHPHLRWALAGALAALLSTPAPFTVGGCALALAATPRFRSDPRALGRLALACLPAALLFAAQLLTVYHSSDTVSFMQGYWANSFLAPHVARAVIGLLHAVRDLWSVSLFGGTAAAYLPGQTVGVMLLLSVAGTVALARRNRTGMALLLAPFALASCASLAHLWPLTPRLLLFAVPAVFVTASAGLAAVARLAPARARAPVFLTFATLVIAGVSLGTLSVLRDPPRSDPLPEAMAYLREQQGKDMTVYLSAYLEPACTYYSAWHPKRPKLARSAPLKTCTIPGARMVYGEWPPPPDSSDPPLPDGTEPPVPAAWVTNESARILGAATGELWLIIEQGRSGAGVVIPEIERAGAVRLAERRWARITAYQYRVPPDWRPPRPGS